MTEVLRLAMRASPRGVLRIVAEFPSAHAPVVARHAAAIAALSGCEWSIQTTMGRRVDVLAVAEPEPPPVAPADPPAPPAEPQTSALAGLWALIRGRQ